jgi:cellulose biosynthesis protein BcsQ
MGKRGPKIKEQSKLSESKTEGLEFTTRNTQINKSRSQLAYRKEGDEILETWRH